MKTNQEKIEWLRKSLDTWDGCSSGCTVGVRALLEEYDKLVARRDADEGDYGNCNGCGQPIWKD